jgi:dynein heavy chain
MKAGRLTRKVEDLDSLRFMKDLLMEIREMETSIEMEIIPVMEMYEMLEHNLPSDFMDEEEIDKKTVLTSNWKKLVKLSQSRNDELSRTQLGFKSALIEDVTVFSLDIQQVSSLHYYFSDY